jgi:ATP-dependent exoDNAse (exonuclease V) beta subunit
MVAAHSARLAARERLAVANRHRGASFTRDGVSARVRPDEAAAEFWKTAAAAKPSVEVPFLIGEGRQLLSGVVDLMHREDVGWMITDYKTDVESTPERAAAYVAQLESYERALAACGLPMAGAKLAPVRARE